MFFDLSARTKLRISGTDRLRFLNGQITNDASKATASSVISAAVLNTRGKMEAYMFLSQGADCFYADADPELREKLQARLERYVIADDVEITDVSGEFSIFHLAAKERPILPDFCRIVQGNRFRMDGWDIWVDMAKREEVFGQLSGVHCFCDDACMEVFRIERGTPRWSRELTEEIIPVEANLEGNSINYEKGCYIGQEVISRMKMSGQRNKKLCGFISLYDSPLEPGMKVFPMGEGTTREAGWITSAVHSKRLGKEIGLGYIKRPFYHATYRLDALDPDTVAPALVRIEIADIPFTNASPGK